MPNLLDAFDAYKDFELDAYFVVCYDTLPSGVSLRVPLKGSKENMEEVLSKIDFERFALETMAKKWITKDDKGADGSKDYVYGYLWKSNDRKLIVSLALDQSDLSVHFLYEHTDTETEAWVLETNHRLRSSYGEEKKSFFKVLSYNERRFYTEDIQANDLGDIDITSLYNDDFEEVDATIMKAMDESRSGLVLLHGEPGTGKTSYIKSLISRFKNRSFIFVQNDFVRDLLKPEFISFLVRHKDSILIVEDAEKVIMSRENNNEVSVVSTILQLTDGLFSDYLNIKIICTFNTDIEKVDKALLRKGRMIAKYEFKPLAQEKATKLLTSLGHKDKAEKDMALADIFRWEDKDFNEPKPKRRIGF